MKRQILSLLAGAALLATPVMTQMVSAQAMGGGGMPRMAQGLNLTATQKAQMKVIQDRTRTQIEAVLTPAQKAQAAAAKKARAEGGARKTGVRKEGAWKEGDRKGGGMYKSLNLTDAQKAQIKTIMAASRKEIEALLTPEQKAQMQQKMQQRMNKRAK
jgi:periplasmic protein CpxP/Spy